MVQTFIPGWESEITINSEDLTVVGNVLSFTRTKASNPKPVFGQQFRNELPGQAGGALSASGHISTEKVQALEAMFDAATSVDYSIQAGTAGDLTDGGQWTGLLVVTELTIDTDAEGEWEWSIAATLDGAPLYTPAVP